MNKDAKIYVAGHEGLVGSAIVRLLQQQSFTKIITRTMQQLDLRDQQATYHFFEHEQPEYVFLAAAKVGGIKANNDFPASFIYDNLMIEANVIHAAYKVGVKKLLFLGSSCIYPRECAQPISENYLLTGSLEPTNKAYAIAKIAGIELCRSYNYQYGTNFISCMPTNLYGPYDNFDYETSHVLPALIAKMSRASQEGAQMVMLWGSGHPRREFLYVDDLAQALLFLMEHYSESLPINIGTGEDISIKELALLIKEIVGYKGDIIFDATKPDGTPRKLLNVEKINKLGWRSNISLYDGIVKTIEWYKKSR